MTGLCQQSQGPRLLGYLDASLRLWGPLIAYSLTFCDICRKNAIGGRDQPGVREPY